MPTAPIPLLSLLVAGPLPQATAIRVEQAPVIDGVLDEELWSLATVVADFHQAFPREGDPPSELTEARLLYDDASLYVGIMCHVGDLSRLVLRVGRRDRDLGADGVRIEIDPEGSSARGYVFELNAAGVQRDGVRTGDDAVDYGWDAVWRGTATTVRDGYVVEMAIPLTALRFDGGDAPTWGLEIERFIAARDERVQWALIPRQEAGVLAHFGRLERPAVSPPLGVTVLPFVRAGSGLEARSGGRDLGFGGDVRFLPSTSVSLLATVLPDFGQVEADEAQLNLTTFELELPEKRPFFTESGDALALTDAGGEATGTQIFYSRRVGAPAPEPALPAGATAVGVAEPLRLGGAAQLLAESDGFSVALFDGTTLPAQARLNALEGPIDEDLAPVSNYSALRVQKDVGRGFRLGVEGAAVLRREPPGSLGLDALCPDDAARARDGRCTRDAGGAAVELGWRDGAEAWVADAKLFASRVQGGPTQVLPDGTRIASGDGDVGARFELAKRDGHVMLDAVYEGYGEKLDLNQTGYLRTQNLHRIFVRSGWRSFDVGPAQETTTAVEVFGRQTWDGRLPIARGIQLNNSATFSNGWESWLELQLFPHTFDNRETRDGTASERPAQQGVEWWLSTSRARSLTFSTEGLWNTTWKGSALATTNGVTLQAFERWEVFVGVTLDFLRGDPRWLDSVEDAEGTRYVYGLQQARAVGATSRLGLTLSPHLTIQLFANLFQARVGYDRVLESEAHTPTQSRVRLAELEAVDVDGAAYAERQVQTSAQLLLRWEYAAGSFLSLAYSSFQEGTGTLSLRTLRGPTDHRVLLKLSYYWAS